MKSVIIVISKVLQNVLMKGNNNHISAIWVCTEIISPIISSDTIIGYVMCGQFFRLIPCTKMG